MFKLKLPEIIKNKKNSLAQLPGAADSWFAATLVQQTNLPLLYIVNDGYQLHRVEQELGLFASGLRVEVFPDYEILPYERQSPNNDLIARRLRVLWQINQNQIDILLVQASNMLQLLPPVNYIHSRVLVIKCGDKLDINLLRSKLIAVDYQLVNQVLENGEFAIRGSIIDIMPMGAKDALRIDLFDDEVESLAIFDRKTQRIMRNVDSIKLVPNREYPYDHSAIANVYQKFINKFPNQADSEFARDLRNNILPAGIEFYLPLFFEKCATIFDYLNSDWQIVYQHNLHDNLEHNYQEIVKRYNFHHYQYPCLAPAELFISIPQIFAEIKTLTSFEEAKLAGFYPNFKQLPDVKVNDKTIAPWNKLAEIIDKYIVVICVDSLGRLEILRQTLATQNLSCVIIEQIDNAKSGQINLILANLYNGFAYDNYVLLGEADLYSDIQYQIRRKTKVKNVAIDNDLRLHDVATIELGELVVHSSHGIGRYLGLTTQTIDDLQYDMIELEYQNNSRLFIPVQNLHLISRYVQLEGSAVELSKLGSNSWTKTKAKIEQKINDVAAQLLELYAIRQNERRLPMNIPNEYSRLIESFGYEPTVDQQRSFDEVSQNLSSNVPMDRLICGDVGFGKTEVAIRAAFIAAMNGYQVAILAPTTLLVEQLYQKLVNRLNDFAFNIAEVSRFRSKVEIKRSLELLSLGQIDIIIGTHRLLQTDIKFANLGLVIIDEEHRFGVSQKEQLKQKRANVNVLSMTATPIPRTLSMALDGLRDFSIIATPPSRRLSVSTILMSADDAIIREAIMREIRRGGQIFFLYNDVASIEQMYRQLINLVPELRIAIAHGQMPELQLEQTVNDFIRQKYNLLLCTTIIETGIDIPNANTILIYRADKFGLAQLHQLRGRVGRSHHQAYCYLLVPENISPDAQKRLEAITATSHLGGGFNLAMHDLEIRGAGEILGANQSGNIKNVGLSLYSEMLKKALDKLKAVTDNNFITTDFYCEVKLNVSAILPDKYCPDVSQRLSYYKQLSRATNHQQIDEIYRDIIDYCGLPGEFVNNLINQHYLRVELSQFGICKLEATANWINMLFVDKPPLSPQQIVNLMQQLKTCRFDGKKLVWQVKSATIEEKIAHIKTVLAFLAAG